MRDRGSLVCSPGPGLAFQGCIPGYIPTPLLAFAQPKRTLVVRSRTLISRARVAAVCRPSWSRVLNAGAFKSVFQSFQSVLAFILRQSPLRQHSLRRPAAVPQATALSLRLAMHANQEDDWSRNRERALGCFRFHPAGLLRQFEALRTSILKLDLLDGVRDDLDLIHSRVSRERCQLPRNQSPCIHHPECCTRLAAHLARPFQDR